MTGPAKMTWTDSELAERLKPLPVRELGAAERVRLRGLETWRLQKIAADSVDTRAPHAAAVLKQRAES